MRDVRMRDVRNRGLRFRNRRGRDVRDRRLRGRSRRSWSRSRRRRRGWSRSRWSFRSRGSRDVRGLRRFGFRRRLINGGGVRPAASGPRRTCPASAGPPAARAGPTTSGTGPSRPRRPAVRGRSCRLSLRRRPGRSFPRGCRCRSFASCGCGCGCGRRRRPVVHCSLSFLPRCRCRLFACWTRGSRSRPDRPIGGSLRDSNRRRCFGGKGVRGVTVQRHSAGFHSCLQGRRDSLGTGSRRSGRRRLGILRDRGRNLLGNRHRNHGGNCRGRNRRAGLHPGARQDRRFLIVAGPGRRGGAHCATATATATATGHRVDSWTRRCAGVGGRALRRTRRGA